MKKKIPGEDVGVKKKECQYTVAGNVNQGSPCGKQYVGFTKNK